MNAADRLRSDGFTLALNAAGGLVVAPAARLDDATRGYIRMHLGEIKAELRQPANDATPRFRVWTVRLIDGSACTAIRPEGFTEVEMMAVASDQFGAERVIEVEAVAASEVRR